MPTALPHLGVGAASPPAASGRSSVRVWDTLGHTGQAQSGLRQVRETLDKSLPNREKFSPGVSRGRAHDHRSIEVLASGLPLHHGAQIAVDITLRCALRSCGYAHVHAAVMNGAVLARAREEKERKYVELLDADRCRLVVIAMETATKLWLPWTHLPPPAPGKAPAVLRRSVHLSWRRRWSRMLPVSCARAFAASLVALPASALPGTDGATPDLADLFTE